MIKYIYFDCDGVLTLNEDGYKLMSQHIAVAYGGDYLSVFDAISNYRHDLALGELQFEDFWPEFCDTIGLDIPLDDFYTSIVTNINKNEEMFELARSFHKQGYKLGIITNNPPKRAQILTNLRGLSHTFDVIALPSHASVGSLKSDTKIFAHALKALGATAEESIFIDNKEKNLSAPKKMGFATYHFDTLNSDIEALKMFLSTLGVTVSEVG